MSRVRGERCIGYVLGPSATTEHARVRSEVAALSASGVKTRVFVKRDHAEEGADPALTTLECVVPYGPLRRRRARLSILRHLATHPWIVSRVWRFVAAQRYDAEKSIWRDRDLLYEAVELAHAVRTNGVTHVHSPAIGRPATVALVAARLASATYSVDASGAAMHRVTARQGVADLVREATFVVTSSHFDKRFLEQLLEGAQPPSVHVIYDGIDLDSLSAPQHRRSGLTKTYRLLALGPLVERSGFRDLLHACALMRERGLDFACDVIGAPDARANSAAWVELRKLHGGLDLESFVHFWGAQPAEAVARAYSGADVVVLPGVVARDGSLDSLPRPLLEAMAAGLTVVASTAGAVGEMVTDGVDGVLVPPGDPRALASALEKLAGDATLRGRLGAAARSKAEARFGVERSTALALTFRRLVS